MPKTIKVTVPVKSEQEACAARYKLEQLFGEEADGSFSNNQHSVIATIRDHPFFDRGICFIAGKVKDAFGMHHTMQPAVSLLAA